MMVVEAHLPLIDGQILLPALDELSFNVIDTGDSAPPYVGAGVEGMNQDLVDGLRGRELPDGDAVLPASDSMISTIHLVQ